MADTPLMERICEAGENLEIWRVHHTALREQEKNARVMTPEMMDRLTENIRKEKRLESLPLGVLRGGDKPYVEVISGHHRTRSAVVAGVTTFLVLVDTRDLTPDQVRAKQLAHNSINGTDNETMLRQIFAEIGSVDSRLEAFVQVDDKYLGRLEEAMRVVNEEVSIRWPVLSIAFLPGQKSRFDTLVARLAKQVPKDADQLWLVGEDAAKAFSDALNRLGRKLDIRTTGNIFARMVEITNAHLDSLAAAEAAEAAEKHRGN